MFSDAELALARLTFTEYDMRQALPNWAYLAWAHSRSTDLLPALFLLNPYEDDGSTVIADWLCEHVELSVRDFETIRAALRTTGHCTSSLIEALKLCSLPVDEYLRNLLCYFIATYSPPEPSLTSTTTSGS